MFDEQDQAPIAIVNALADGTQVSLLVASVFIMLGFAGAVRVRAAAGPTPPSV